MTSFDISGSRSGAAEDSNLVVGESVSLNKCFATFRKVTVCSFSTVACVIHWRWRYSFTYLLTPWCRVLQKLTCSQLVKKFPAFYGTRMFITAFKSARHLKFLSLHHPSVDLWGYISISVYSKYPNSARVVVLIWLLLLRLYAMSADTFVLEKLKCRTKSVQ